MGKSILYADLDIIRIPRGQRGSDNQGWTVQIFAVLLTTCKFIDAVSSRRCLCPGDTISYECTVTGTEVGSTVWTGSAFNDAEIVLLHRRFHQGTRNVYMYRNSIVARSLSVEGNNYTSQLNVTVTPATAGKTIGCIHDNGTHEIFIFSSIIPTITG